jgi:4-hydroxy-tetrahydrodipicolinate reductase
LARPADVLVDFTSPESVKQRTLEALAAGVRVVIGTSGLTTADYADIERTAVANRLGVIAAGNFSLTAALAKPSGTTRELAEALGEVASNRLAVPVERTHGERQARGATVAGTQVHSVRLPGIVRYVRKLIQARRAQPRDDLVSSSYPGGGSGPAVERGRTARRPGRHAAAPGGIVGRGEGRRPAR